MLQTEGACLVYGCHLARLHHNHCSHAYTPMSNTASHDNPIFVFFPMWVWGSLDGPLGRWSSTKNQIYRELMHRSRFIPEDILADRPLMIHKNCLRINNSRTQLILPCLGHKIEMVRHVHLSSHKYCGCNRPRSI